jgi:pyrimidine deaminase RibD-like protein
VRRDDDREWLAAAIELSGKCPPADSAFSVGAILVSADGEVIATGYSRETDPKDHAEEVALARAGDLGLTGAALTGATLYSSLEPCLARVSRLVACAELVAHSGVRRVVIAWREPPVFQPGGGAAWLERQGIEVVELPELADVARAANRQVLDRH